MYPYCKDEEVSNLLNIIFLYILRFHLCHVEIELCAITIIDEIMKDQIKYHTTNYTHHNNLYASMIPN